MSFYGDENRKRTTMNNVNKTLYIPLYGKASVSSKGIILKDSKAEEIWEQEGFELKGKSKSKWLAYYMGMRSAVFDNWLKEQMQKDDEAVVLHIGCGMDSRVLRVGTCGHLWYDIDFPEVIHERGRYFQESEEYHMIGVDVRKNDWLEQLPTEKYVILVMEGVSMYLKPEELQSLLKSLENHMGKMNILMDCYTEFAAKASKYKNPINEVGVSLVYGMENPKLLEEHTGLTFVKEHEMTPEVLINELSGVEKLIFKKIYGGNLSRKMYRLYEYRT